MTESFPICSNPPHLEVKLATVGPAMGPGIKILEGHPQDEEVESGKEGEKLKTPTCLPRARHRHLLDHQSWEVSRTGPELALATRTKSRSPLQWPSLRCGGRRVGVDRLLLLAA